MTTLGTSQILPKLRAILEEKRGTDTGRGLSIRAACAMQKPLSSLEEEFILKCVSYEYRDREATDEDDHGHEARLVAYFEVLDNYDRSSDTKEKVIERLTTFIYNHSEVEHIKILLKFADKEGLNAKLTTLLRTAQRLATQNPSSKSSIPINITPKREATAELKTESKITTPKAETYKLGTLEVEVNQMMVGGPAFEKILIQLTKTYQTAEAENDQTTIATLNKNIFDFYFRRQYVTILIKNELKPHLLRLLALAGEHGHFDSSFLLGSRYSSFLSTTGETKDIEEANYFKTLYWYLSAQKAASKLADKYKVSAEITSTYKKILTQGIKYCSDLNTATDDHNVKNFNQAFIHFWIAANHESSALDGIKPELIQFFIRCLSNQDDDIDTILYAINNHPDSAEIKSILGLTKDIDPKSKALRFIAFLQKKFPQQEESAAKSESELQPGLIDTPSSQGENKKEEAPKETKVETAVPAIDSPKMSVEEIEAKAAAEKAHTFFKTTAAKYHDTFFNDYVRDLGIGKKEKISGFLEDLKLQINAIIIKEFLGNTRTKNSKASQELLSMAKCLANYLAIIISTKFEQEILASSLTEDKLATEFAKTIKPLTTEIITTAGEAKSETLIDPNSLGHSKEELALLNKAHNASYVRVFILQEKILDFKIYNPIFNLKPTTEGIPPGFKGGFHSPAPTQGIIVSAGAGAATVQQPKTAATTPQNRQ